MIPPSTAKTRTFRVGEKCITVFEPSSIPYMIADARTIFVIDPIIGTSFRYLLVKYNCIAHTNASVNTETMAAPIYPSFGRNSQFKPTLIMAGAVVEIMNSLF